MHQEAVDVTEENAPAAGVAPTSAHGAAQEAGPTAPVVWAESLPADLHTILGGIAAGVTVQDEQGRLLFVNEDAARLVGFASPDEMLQATPGELVDRFELVDEDGRPFDRSQLPGRRALAGEPVEPVLVGFRPLGGLVDRWSLLVARRATLVDGRTVAISTFHDITPRIEAEQQIRDSERTTQQLAEARRRAEEIARMLADAALRLDQATNVATVVQAAAEVTIPVIADWCVVDLIQADGAIRRAAIAARDEDLQARIEPLRDHPALADPTRASRQAISSGAPVIILDIEAWWASESPPDPDLRRVLASTGIRSAIAQPLTARGEVIGSIVMATVGERTFDSEAISASLEIALRVGLAIGNVRSYESEQQARRAAEELADRMERLQAVTRTLAEAMTVEDVVAIVADEARRALAADAVIVGLLDDSSTRLDIVVREGRGLPPIADETSVSVDSDDPLATAVREVRAVWAAGGEGGRTFDSAARSGSAVPLVADQAALGALWLGFDGRRSFAPADQRLASAYADLAAGAIVRLRLGAVRQLLLAANEAERARLESVLRRMPIGVILAAVSDGRFLYVNEAARRLAPMPITIGDTPAYAETRGYRPDGSELAEDEWPLRRAMGGETVENEVIEIVAANGPRRTFSLSSAPIPGPSGAIESAVVTYSDVTDGIRAQEREHFLARASEVLASSLDYERTIQAVADLAVPAFADWCVVQLASEEGVPQRLAVAHRDPELVALATQAQEEYPPDPESPTGVAAILRTGRSEYMADVPPEMVDAAAQDERHRDLLRSLSLRSYIAVPMIAVGRIIGVLTLVGNEGGRRFEPDDVSFAQSLANRAAAAIENARLFREGVRFKRLLDATGDAVLMLEPDAGRIAYANRGAAEQLERPVDDLIGSLIGEHLDVTGKAALGEAMADLAEGATNARTVTLEVRRPSGSILPVEVRLEYVAPDGAPARILAIARDIRDRIHAQERLRGLAAAEHARAAELNAVIRAMGDGVVVCDSAGRIILANPAAEDVFPDVEETTFDEILAQLDDPDGLAPALGARGGPVELRVRADEERWIEISTWPVASGRDRVTGHEDETIVLLRDVTEQRQQQAVRDTFIGVLSHELRTPVTTIYAGAKVLARPGTLPEDTRQEIFDDMVVESERLHRLVEDVVAMTRFGDEGGDVGAEPVLLQRLLPSVVSSEDSRWPGVSFEAIIPPGLPTVIADPTYVEQVVRNLLSNAAKYGGAGASVTASLEAIDREILVRIIDDGPGFPPDESERLFELFFRSAQTARAAAGAGIGLFVCARLIKAMGGRIWATSRPEGGAEFGFALRIMDED